MHAQLLEASDVAQALKISKSHVYMLIRTGELNAVKFGKSVRVRQEDLEGFISEKLSRPDDTSDIKEIPIPQRKHQ